MAPNGAKTPEAPAKALSVPETAAQLDAALQEAARRDAEVAALAARAAYAGDADPYRKPEPADDDGV